MKGHQMTVTSIRNIAAAAIVGLAFAATSAQAFTLTNNGAAALLKPGVETIQGSPATYTFNYTGGNVKFLLEDTSPDFQTVGFKLVGASPTTTFTLSDVLDTLAKPFYLANLAAGAYTLTLTTAADSARVYVSAVPLPGAALLFGSSALGFLGLRKRRNA
jgi:hypothetical protein